MPWRCHGNGPEQSSASAFALSAIRMTTEWV
jgi:hypothetical protein